jgi:ABC-2 type transport system permease protein
MRAVLAIAGVNLRRLLRDRTNAFFLVVFPMLMITVLGLAFGGGTEPRVALVAPASPLASGLAGGLEAASGVEVQPYDDRASAVDAVEEGRAEAAVLVPPGYDARVLAGRQVRVEYVSRSDRTAQQVNAIVRAAVDEQAARLRIARVVAGRTDLDVAVAMRRTDAVAPTVALVEVDTRTAGEAVFPESLGRFDLGASSQLLLFVFITSMTAAAALVETRRLGVTRRVFATPTPVSRIVVGEALGRIGIATVQGLIIMVGAALIFGVSWGSLGPALLLMLCFATVAGSAGLVLGALASTSQQAIAAGLLLGLGLSALGGSMMPLEFFSPTLLLVAHFTPHAWAADGYAELVRHDGTLVAVLPELGVLVLYAVVLFTLGSWLLRRRILRG